MSRRRARRRVAGALEARRGGGRRRAGGVPGAGVVRSRERGGCSSTSSPPPQGELAPEPSRPVSRTPLPTDRGAPAEDEVRPPSPPRVCISSGPVARGARSRARVAGRLSGTAPPVVHGKIERRRGDVVGRHRQSAGGKATTGPDPGDGAALVGGEDAADCFFAFDC